MDLKEEKAGLRKLIKEKQKKLSVPYCNIADELICKRIIALPDYDKANTVFCFVSTAEEIDTSLLLKDIWKKGKRLLVPKCGKKGIMYAHVIFSEEDLEEGKYGILEPKEHCPIIPPEKIDFGIIPCVSSDEKGYRLGHGGGYYDRYLEGQTFPTAVICRELLLLHKTPTEPFDLQMDWLVTEERAVKVKKQLGLEQ